MKLALGTVQFGLEYGIANQAGRVSGEEARNILTEARSHGIRMLDTAIAYGNSEEVLGSIGVAGFQIVSKLPAVPDKCLDVSRWVTEQVVSSLKRLGVPQLHAVLLHRPDQLFSDYGPQLYAALNQIKVQGLTRKIGISIYAPEELDRLFSDMDFDLVQSPLNILDRRLIDSGWAAKLKDKNVELHVRSSFLQGLLLMTQAQRPAKFARWQSIWAEWNYYLEQYQLTPLAACLRYVLSVEEIDHVVFGVDNTLQLKEILTAADGALPQSLPNWPSAIDPDLINPSRWNQL